MWKKYFPKVRLSIPHPLGNMVLLFVLFSLLLLVMSVVIHKIVSQGFRLSLLFLLVTGVRRCLFLFHFSHHHLLMPQHSQLAHRTIHNTPSLSSAHWPRHLLSPTQYL